MKIEPDLLIAYADGELDDVTAKRIEKAIASDPALAAQVEQRRDLRARLRSGFDPVRDAPISAPAVLDVSGKVVDLSKIRRARQLPATNPWWRRTATIAAAALVIGVTLGVVMEPGPEADYVEHAGRLVATGELATALTGEAKAAPGDDSAVRVLVSFRNEGGAFCRAFEGDSADGIACRNGAHWDIRQLRASSGTAADAPVVLADAHGMMEGPALDPAGERAALQRGWN